MPTYGSHESVDEVIDLIIDETREIMEREYPTAFHKNKIRFDILDKAYDNFENEIANRLLDRIWRTFEESGYSIV